MSYKTLKKAKEKKNDEYYTRMVDVKEELDHYKKWFKHKIIYCNCDDPEWSNFYLYFKENFKELQLEKLMSTHYVSEGSSYLVEYDGVEEVRTELQGNGDFRSIECLMLMKECDIVVTNPPFSLLRDLIDMLMEYDKKFIIMGTVLGFAYSTVFPYVRTGVFKPGFTYNKNMKFYVPEGADYEEIEEETGRKVATIGTISFFTNLNIESEREPLKLTATYSPEKYPKYDTMDFISVNKLSEIPCDYYDFMGVPVTYLGYHDPKLFYIWDLTCNAKVEGENLFKRIIIRRIKEGENPYSGF